MTERIEYTYLLNLSSSLAYSIWGKSPRIGIGPIRLAFFHSN